MLLEPARCDINIKFAALKLSSQIFKHRSKFHKNYKFYHRAVSLVRICHDTVIWQKNVKIW